MVIIYVIAAIFLCAALVNQCVCLTNTIRKADIDKRIRNNARTIVFLSGGLIFYIPWVIASIFNDTYTTMNAIGSICFIAWLVMSVINASTLIDQKTKSGK